MLRTGIVGARLTSETISGYEEENNGGVIETFSTNLKKSNVQTGLNLTYMATDHVGVEFMLTSPFSHKVTGHDSVLPFAGQYGKIKQMPLSLTAVYYPLDKQSTFQPYVGAGINYTFASFKLNGAWNDARVAAGEDAVTAGEIEDALGVKNRLGFNVVLGADVSLTKNWLLNVHVRYVRTNNKAGDDEGVHMAKGTIYTMLGVGYKF